MHTKKNYVYCTKLNARQASHSNITISTLIFPSIYRYSMSTSWDIQRSHSVQTKRCIYYAWHKLAVFRHRSRSKLKGCWRSGKNPSHFITPRGVCSFFPSGGNFLPLIPAPARLRLMNRTGCLFVFNPVNINIARRDRNERKGGRGWQIFGMYHPRLQSKGWTPVEPRRLHSVSVTQPVKV